MKKINSADELKDGQKYALESEGKGTVTAVFYEQKPIDAKPGCWVPQCIPYAAFDRVKVNGEQCLRDTRQELFDWLKQLNVEIYLISDKEKLQ